MRAEAVETTPEARLHQAEPEETTAHKEAKPDMDQAEVHLQEAHLQVDHRREDHRPEDMVLHQLESQPDMDQLSTLNLLQPAALAIKGEFLNTYWININFIYL